MTARISDATAFAEWVRVAQPGEQVCYHVGCLAIDREGNQALDKLAAEALRHSDRGAVLLAQRQGQYLAIRSRTRRRTWRVA